MYLKRKIDGFLKSWKAAGVCPLCFYVHKSKLIDMNSQKNALCWFCMAFL